MLATESPALKPSSEASTQTTEAPKRGLADLVHLICKDAKSETVHYLLRSNTSQDGE